MSGRMPIAVVLLSVLSVPQADGKNKKKQQLLPDHVLKAETILVVIHPEAGEPLTNPRANRTAQEEVEKAIMKWGRFRLVMDSQTADLVIAVRRGHANGPTIRNSPTDDRPVIGQQTDDQIRVGVQRGRPPDLTNPGFGGPERRRPHVTNEVGPSEDMFEVYLGGIDYPLDSSPVWRYMAKDALNGPQVDAVEQFRKAIADSEEQRRLRQKH
jgi:hypothetical protein